MTTRTPLPTWQQWEQLSNLRRSVIDIIETIGRTRGTADGGDNIVCLTHQDEPHARHSAVFTALAAAAFACTDTREEFMRMAAEAYQLKIDEESEEDGAED